MVIILKYGKTDEKYLHTNIERHKNTYAQI